MADVLLDATIITRYAAPDRNQNVLYVGKFFEIKTNT